MSKTIQNSSANREGLTLIEVLMAMTILVILTSIPRPLECGDSSPLSFSTGLEVEKSNFSPAGLKEKVEISSLEISNDR